MCHTTNAAIEPLRELSARIGGDPLLTQASTGNTSVKIDGVLWIKASGKWLAGARADDFFIPVDLTEAAHCMQRGIDPAEHCSRASIETAMHAALPHRVVVHVHSVNTIAWAIRADAPQRLSERLLGLDWKWIPYVASGLPLARAIEKAMRDSPRTNILVLGNHGLVVCGEDSDDAADLLCHVEHRLAIAPRLAPAPDLERLRKIAAGTPWTLPADTALHALGTDPFSREILSRGFLYPCHAIFLNNRASARPFLILEAGGMLVSQSIPSADYAMLNGLAQVVQRTGESAPIRYLTETVNVNAYRYRDLANMNCNS